MATSQGSDPGWTANLSQTILSLGYSSFRADGIREFTLASNQKKKKSFSTHQ